MRERSAEPPTKRAVEPVTASCPPAASPRRLRSAERRLVRVVLPGADVAGDAGQRGQKQVAKAVSFQSLAGREPVTKEAGNQVFIFGEGDHAIAQIARREHVKATAQSAAGTAVIRDRDHRGQIGYDARGVFAVSR